MASNKHLFQDRTALLLVSAATFMSLAAVVLLLLKLNATRGTVNYIISYRATLGIDRYAIGTLTDVLSFGVAAGLIFIFGIALAYRAYKVKRELALTVLALTVILLAFLMVVSNSLLALR